MGGAGGQPASTECLPFTAPAPGSSHLLLQSFTALLSGRYFYYLHFMDKESEKRLGNLSKFIKQVKYQK